MAYLGFGKGRHNRGLGAEPPAGSRGRDRAPGQGVGGQALLKLK